MMKYFLIGGTRIGTSMTVLMSIFCQLSKEICDHKQLIISINCLRFVVVR